MFEKSSELDYQWGNCEIFKINSFKGQYNVSFLNAHFGLDRFISDLNAVSGKKHLIFIVDEFFKEHLNFIGRPVLYLKSNEEQKSYDGVGKVIEKLLDVV